MSQQYLRNCSLIVAKASGSGLELGQFRVRFEVRRGDTQTPNTLDATVYNLAPNTVRELKGGGVTAEFTMLRLACSYGDTPPKQIFLGSIKQVRSGRENATDTYVTFTAADSDGAYNYSSMALTLAAGNTRLQGVQSVIRAMAATAVFGSPLGGSGGQQVTQGYLPSTLSQRRNVRARTYFGPCKHEMRTLATNSDCTWHIQDGQVTLTPLALAPAVNPEVLITPKTGLIGMPEQTQNGLMVRVLLNPNIKIGTVIKLESTDINEFRYGTDLGSQATNINLSKAQAKLNGDGLYYVMRCEHFGDTRGTEWYSDLTCLAVDASAPKSPIPGSQGIEFAGAIKRY